MGQYETIRGNVADVYVVNDDIAATARITQNKLGTDVGKTIKVTTPALTAAATAYYTWTGTAAITAYYAILRVDSAGTTGALSFSNTTGATMISLAPTTTAATFQVSTGMASIAAGASLELHCTASQANSAVCTLIFSYINT